MGHMHADGWEEFVDNIWRSRATLNQPYGYIQKDPFTRQWMWWAYSRFGTHQNNFVIDTGMEDDLVLAKAKAIAAIAFNN